ncbi:MAG TPA: endonuclease III [Nitrososphaeria archaeon]|nr:endonuclease III [Conexivisphaerales archaeon]HEU16353.1 endonuclease III [Nitrososphaeria archaeon]
MGDDGQDTLGGEGEAGVPLGSRILRRLVSDPSLSDGYFLVDRASPGCADPFRTLVATVLSQNTNDRNGYRAFSALERSVGVTPWSISRAPLEVLEKAIRPAGMYRGRARKLRALASAVVERYGGDLSRALSGDLERARAALMELPGVGPKTADVVLLFCASMPTFPVDTHISRISRRLGLARTGAGYEEMRSTLQSIFDPRDYAVAHRALIQLGRVYCRARGPRCAECPIRDLCPRVGVAGSTSISGEKQNRRPGQPQAS